MSLYNMMFGANPNTHAYLKMLGLTPADVPRFRDCFLSKTDDGDVLIAIHTRTGGGNRDYYESEEGCRYNYPEYFKGEDIPTGPWNDDLRSVPGYLRDEDDEFDSTYATFYFKVPELYADAVKALADESPAQTMTPAEKWDALLTALQTPPAKAE